MYVQLIDKDNFKSPVLYIHSDEDEFLEEIEVWKNNLLTIIKSNSTVSGMPLGRLEAPMCIVDLVRHLANYYVESTPFSFVTSGNVWSCLRLLNESEVLETDEEIIQIKTYE